MIEDTNSTIWTGEQKVRCDFGGEGRGMWVVEEFDDESHVRDYDMPAMEDDILRRLITVRNTDDWIRGVGQPIEPDDNHVYFVACYQR